MRFSARFFRPVQIAACRAAIPATVGAATLQYYNCGTLDIRDGGLHLPVIPTSAVALAQRQNAGGSLMLDYDLGPELGKGAFAVVRRGKCRRTGRDVAIKVIPRTKENEESIKQEVAVLQRVGLHCSIARLEAFYETATAFYIVMEYIEGGELFEHLCDSGAYSERDASKLLQQVGGAVALLHAQGICHADIKPENLLLTSTGEVKLVDFGLSCETREASQHKAGTWAYWPPEAFSGGQLGLPMDMWALGVVLFVVLSGYHPFDPHGNGTPEEIQRNISKAEPCFDDPAWQNVSAAALKLVRSLLRPDPLERLTIEELLQHPWMSETDGHTSTGEVSTARLRQSKTNKQNKDFSRMTAKLRAAVFATILQQESRQHNAQRSGRSARLARQSSMRADMLDTDLLSKAFREFDIDCKGYITEADLQRVLYSMGQRDTSGDELHSILQGVTDTDREGKRVTYGNFVRMMSLTVKQWLPEDTYVFRRGDSVRHFYALLSGEVELIKHCPDGSEEVAAKVRAGEYFGENSLLEGRPFRHKSARAVGGPIELLKLSKEDFEVGFGNAPPRVGIVEVFLPSRLTQRTRNWEQERSRLLGFIQMVSPKQNSLILDGDRVFAEGDPVNHFYILLEGTLHVEQQGVRLGEIHPGECFGETSLLSRQPKRTKTITCASSGGCELVSILGADFLRLMEKSSLARESMQDIALKRRSHNEAEESLGKTGRPP
mmetsp:Transcript_38283/g.63359  ORF Transcript_38283/g.63359 Transcript_38283/m.63359 type:complete len:719 (-) Transcript_38283:203-2359(-)